jgi:hypothetical protein
MKFKKILLVQPMHEEKKTKDWDRTSISFPWGLGTLSRFYQKAEYDVEILDGQALKLSKEELLTEFDKLDFDILTTTFPSSLGDRWRLIKPRWFSPPPMWTSALSARERSRELRF